VREDIVANVQQNLVSILMSVRDWLIPSVRLFPNLIGWSGDREIWLNEQDGSNDDYQKRWVPNDQLQFNSSKD
jgi:hypothetical protein